MSLEDKTSFLIADAIKGTVTAIMILLLISQKAKVPKEKVNNSYILKGSVVGLSLYLFSFFGQNKPIRLPWQLVLSTFTTAQMMILWIVMFIVYCVASANYTILNLSKKAPDWFYYLYLGASLAIWTFYYTGLILTIIEENLQYLAFLRGATVLFFASIVILILEYSFYLLYKKIHVNATIRRDGDKKTTKPEHEIQRTEIEAHTANPRIREARNPNARTPNAGTPNTRTPNASIYGSGKSGTSATRGDRRPSRAHREIRYQRRNRVARSILRTMAILFIVGAIVVAAVVITTNSQFNSSKSPREIIQPDGFRSTNEALSAAPLLAYMYFIHYTWEQTPEILRYIFDIIGMGCRSRADSVNSRDSERSSLHCLCSCLSGWGFVDTEELEWAMKKHKKSTFANAEEDLKPDPENLYQLEQKTKKQNEHPQESKIQLAQSARIGSSIGCLLNANNADSGYNDSQPIQSNRASRNEERTAIRTNNNGEDKGRDTKRVARAAVYTSKSNTASDNEESNAAIRINIREKNKARGTRHVARPTMYTST